MPEAGKTTLNQTPQFREAVKTCLTEGYAPLEIASAIHDKAINDGRYPGDSMGTGANFDKICNSVYKRNSALKNQK